MKKASWIFLLAWMGFSGTGTAQSQEAQQLLLDVEKLARFKQILSDMEAGYRKLRTGYEQVSQLAQGNFTLHKRFLDSLLWVSPGVKRYYLVAEILHREQDIVRECHDAWTSLQRSGQFHAAELHYISEVYDALLNSCRQDLGDLAAILAAGQLRMNDGARLSAIDGLYADLTAVYRFLYRFNRQNRLLALQRLRAQKDIDALKRYYGHLDP